MAQFQMDAALRDRTNGREAELEVGGKPVGLEVVPRLAQFHQHVFPVEPDEIRQHEPVVQRRSPAHQRMLARGAPELRDERTHHQLLRDAHARMRRHFERPHLNQTQPRTGRFRRIQLVDTKLRAMRVARQIDQQIAEDAVYQPRRDRFRARVGHLVERDLHLVERIEARFVDARMLAGRADKQP